MESIDNSFQTNLLRFICQITQSYKSQIMWQEYVAWSKKYFRVGQKMFSLNLVFWREEVLQFMQSLI